MSDLEFDTEEIKDFSSRMSLTATGIDSELLRLELAVSLLRTQWSGDAQSAFDHAQGEWSTSMRDLKSILQAISQACDSAAQTYETTEKSIEKAFAA